MSPSRPALSETEQFASAWATLRMPGMTVLTAGWASANWIATSGSVQAGSLELLADLLGARHRALEAVAGEVAPAEVVGRERRLARELAGQDTLVEHHAHDDRGVRLVGDRQQLGGRLLLEDVVDDLHRVDPAAAHQVDDAVLVVLGRRDRRRGGSSPRRCSFRRTSSGRRVAVPGARPGVQLQQVDALRAEVAQPLLDVSAQVALGVALLVAVVGLGGQGPGAGGVFVAT